MANAVAYLELALEKFTGLYPNEDARDSLDIVEKNIAFSLGTRPADAGGDQDAYDNRQKASFLSHIKRSNRSMVSGISSRLNLERYKRSVHR